MAGNPARPSRLVYDIKTGKKIVKVHGCLWGISTMGQIAVSWFGGPLTDDEIAQLINMTKNNPGTADLKKANYKETTKRFSPSLVLDLCTPGRCQRWHAHVHLRRWSERSGSYAHIHEPQQNTHD